MDTREAIDVLTAMLDTTGDASERQALRLAIQVLEDSL
jgi:hypothetical protein